MALRPFKRHKTHQRKRLRRSRIGVELLEDRNCPSQFAPIALNDAFNELSSGVLSSDAPGLLANDTDGDSDPLTAHVWSSPINGTLQLQSDGSFTYTPYPGFVGVDTFEYRAYDGTFYSDPAEVTLNVDLAAQGNQTLWASEGSLVTDTVASISSAIAGATAADFTVLIDWGDGNETGGNVLSTGGNNFEIEGAHTYADDGQYPILVTIVDVNNNSVAVQSSISVDNAAPENVDAGDDLQVDEGTPVSFSGSFSDPGSQDTHTFRWEVSSDNGQTVSPGTGQSFNFTPNDNGLYTITFTVQDDGGLEGYESIKVTVSDVAPTVSATGAGQVDEGIDYTLNLSTTGDPGDDTIDSWMIDWGDGASPEYIAGNPSSVVHKYTRPGTFDVYATASDEDGQYQAAVHQVAVNNLAPSITLELTYEYANVVTLSGQVSDASPGNLLVEFTGPVEDSVYTDANGYFSLTVEAYGVGTISASVEDIGGLTSNVAQVTATSQAPEIIDFSVVHDTGNYWIIQGTVSDETPEGLEVVFGGDFASVNGLTATVQADGTFSLMFELLEEGSGMITAQTTDWWYLDSEVESFYLEQ